MSKNERKTNFVEREGEIAGRSGGKGESGLGEGEKLEPEEAPKSNRSRICVKRAESPKGKSFVLISDVAVVSPEELRLEAKGWNFHQVLG